MAADVALPPHLAAVERTRTTALWVLTTLGSVAAALLVGAGLADLGAVHGTWTTIAAVAGAALAAGGIAVAIFAVGRVLAPIQPMRDGLPVSAFRDDYTTAVVQGDPSLLGGLAGDLQEFESEYIGALTELRSAQLLIFGTPSDLAMRNLGAAQAVVQAYEPVAQSLRDLAIHEHARRRFEHAMKVVGFATVFVIVGAVLFNLAVPGAGA